MAMRSKSVCRQPGCHVLVNTSGYCAKHQRESVGWFKTSKKTSHERGYGAVWRRIRERIFERDNGLCQSCLKAGRLRVGQDVDHVIPKSQGGTDDEGNLQLICRACHKAKTARERSGGG